MKRSHLLLVPDGEAGTPAAAAVQNSEASETDAAELVKLRRELADEKSGRKKDQTRLSELEDENRRLKDVPKPKDPPAQQKKSFLDGCTFLD